MAKKGSERAALGSFGRQGASLAAQLGAVNQKQTEEQRKWKEKKARTKHIQTQVINEFSQSCGNSWLKGSLNQDGFWEHQGKKKKEKP